MSRGNYQFVEKMTNLFATETPLALDKIELNIKENNFERARAIVHRIKPSLKMLSMTSIELDVQNLEEYCEKGINLELIPGLFERINTICRKVVNDMTSKG